MNTIPTPPTAPGDEKARAVAAVIARLSVEALTFLRQIMVNPDVKLKGGGPWQELETAGLVRCVGSYKWELTFAPLETIAALSTPPAVMPAAPSDAVRPCEYCDGTGDVHGLDGEWRGVCICPAGAALAQPAPVAAPAPAASEEPALCPNGEPWDDNPDGVVPGQESGPRMSPGTGFWEGADADEDGGEDELADKAIAAGRTPGDSVPGVSTAALVRALARRASPSTPEPAAADDTAALIFKLECFIDHATGGKLSKSSWSLETLKAAHDERLNSYVEEALKEAEPAAASGAVTGEATFENAMRMSWQMVDPFRPSGEPGSYARGEYNGIVAALRTVRDNYRIATSGGESVDAVRSRVLEEARSAIRASVLNIPERDRYNGDLLDHAIFQAVQSLQTAPAQQGAGKDGAV